MTATRRSVGGVAVAGAGPDGAARSEVLARVARTVPGAHRVAEPVTGAQGVARTATHAGDRLSTRVSQRPSDPTSMASRFGTEAASSDALAEASR